MLNRAVLYLRLSNAQGLAGPSDSIARQEADLRALCDRHGWAVGRVLTDDGISGRKVRANATEALRMLREREADVLLVWKLDRWGRRGAADVADLVAVLDERKDARFLALQDGLDSSQQAWRLIASVLSEVGRAEAENTSLRVSASVRSNRSVGRFVGGTVPFGYRTAPRPEGGRTLVVDAGEAAIVREVAERLLGDESQSSILDDLTARGVATTRSRFRVAEMQGADTEGLDRGSWSYAGLAAVWTGEAVVGRSAQSRTERDSSGNVRRVWDVVRGPSGAPLETWEPILDWATAARLRARLRDPKRPTVTRPHRTRRSRLLSGVIFCECGQRLWVTRSGGRVVYTCRREAGRCGGPNMKAENAERAVSEAFLSVAGGASELEQVDEVSGSGVREELARVVEEIAATLENMGRASGDESGLLGRLSALKARRSELEQVPATLTSRLEPTGRTLAEAWEGADVDLRRRLLHEALDHVILKPTATKGHTGYHPERLEIRWLS